MIKFQSRHNRLEVLAQVKRFALLLVCALFLGGAIAQAQEQESQYPPIPVNPAPLSELVSEQEAAQIKKADSPKERVDTYLKLSDTHLDMALSAIKQDQTPTAERELDIYNKMVAEAMKTAFSNEKDRRKLTKKIEQRLFRHIKTLEAIERLFPIERLAFAEAALKKTKRLRVQSLNETFDSGDVLHDPNKEKKGPNDAPGKSGSAPASHPAGAMSFAGAVAPLPSQIPGDYLNEEEDEYVRAAQEPDDRIKVFMKIADRRLEAITGPQAVSGDRKAQEKARKKAEEEERMWGPVPKVERYVLLQHYARALDEAIAKLEDAHERNPKSSALPRALSTLREATERHLKILHSLESQVKDENESVALKQAIAEAEFVNQGARKGLEEK